MAPLTVRNSAPATVPRNVLLGLAALGLLLAVPVDDLPAQERTSELLVIVRDGARRPVPGVEVSIDGGDWHTATTDVVGQARVRVTSGQWEVVALHTEHGVVPTRAVVVVRAGESRAVDFSMIPRDASIQGRLVLQSPMPASLERFSAAAYPADAADGTLPVATAPIEDDGTFTLRVPQGRWRARLLEVARVSEREVTVGRGQEAAVSLQVDFRALTGAAGFAFEAGLITERIGPAFSLTTVGLYVINAPGVFRILTTTQVRADQTYAVLAPLPAESDVHTFAWRPGWTVVPSAVRSRARPGEVAFVDLRFVPNSGAVAGTVVDSLGRPVNDAWIGVASAVRHEDWMIGNRPTRSVDGTFRIRVPFGPLLIRAWRDPQRQGEPQRIQVPGTTPVSVRLVTP